MKKLLLSIMLMLIMSAEILSQVGINLIIRNPVPYRFSRVLDDPSVIQLVVTNFSSQEVRNFRVSFQLSELSRGTIAMTKDFHPRMNKFDIFPGQTKIITGPEVLDPEAIEYNQSIYSSILTSNMLPEGEYFICVSIIDSAGIQISNPAQICQWFSIYHPQPPVLLYPCEQTLANYYPQFQWSPVVGADPSIVINYRIKLAKIFEGQTPREAIENNIPILDRVVTNTTYQYLPSDISLSGYTDIFGFAWQVQAFDALTGEPAAGQNGKSQICALFPPEIQQSNLALTSPPDDSEFSPENGVLRFVWNPFQIYEPYMFLGLKIVEIQDGQSPEVAINTNNPVLWRQDLIKNSTEYLISENDNLFQDGKNYAWQVYALNPQQPPVVFSQVWNFKYKGQAAKIRLTSPQNNSELRIDSVQNVYYFTWDPSQITQSYTNIKIKIVPLENGQNPQNAIQNNEPVYNKNNLPPNTSNITIAKNEGVFGNGLYAWQVSAFDGNQMIAESQVWVFSVTIPPVNLSGLEDFYAHNYRIRVLSITNENSNNFSGQGEVILWEQGPRFVLNYAGLQLVNIGTDAEPRWKLVRGEIVQQLPPTNVNLDYRDPGIPQPIPNGSKYANSVATLGINGLRFTPTSNTVRGTINLKTPFLDAARNDNINLQTVESSFRVHPQTKIDSGLVKLRDALNSTLIDPKDFVYELSQESEFIVSKHKLTLKLVGKAKLPPNVKDKVGNPIIAEFNNAGGFKFDVDKKQNPLNYSVNPDIWIQFDVLDVDIYHGRFFLKEGVIAFDQVKSGGLNSINLDVNDSTYLAFQGLNCNINEDNTTSKTGKFRGYKFNVNEFTLVVVNNKIKDVSNLSGDVVIPFINQNAGFELDITFNGISSGVVDVAGIDDKWINLFTDTEDGTKLNIKVKGLAYNAETNIFSMNATFDYENQPNIGIASDEINVTNLQIDSTGAVKIFGSNDLGVKFLEKAISGTFNGFSISVDRLKVIKQDSYVVGILGSIVMTDDLSNEGGTPFDAEVLIPIEAGGKDAMFENNLLGKSKVNEIPIKFKNKASKFDGKVKWFNNDPVYGKGFLAQLKMEMKKPSYFMVEGKVMIGKTDNGNGFAYWFVEAGVEFNPGIPTTFADISINGFTGRVYSRMKHSGKGISSSDYVPDENNKFGVYAKLPISSTSDLGKKFWGYTDLEIMMNEGFTVVLHGELNLFSSGYKKKDGKIKGDATISVITEPPTFQSTVNVSANLWNALCGNAKLDIYIDKETWHVKFGSKEKPNSMRVMCKDFLTYKNYLEIYPQYTTLGIMYDFDTGEQKWGEVFGCWGRANGNISFLGRMTYQNFNVTANARLSAHANIGVFVDLSVWSGNQTLLEGNVNANLEATFPDPMCMAGSVRAELCFDPCPVFSCEICASATFKMRYKNGEFDLANSCMN